MENKADLSEQKFNAIFDHAPMGLAEIDLNGNINRLNIVGQELLYPIKAAFQVEDDNLYSVLDFIFPEISVKIKNYESERGNVVYNHLHSFKLPYPNDQSERHLQFNVSKVFEDCVIISFEDQTEKRKEEQLLQQIGVDKAIAQGKFEIASEVLHDIGNAVVGFGSYLTRINRSLENDHMHIMKNVVVFLKEQQKGLAGLIGETKAEALVNLLDNITTSQKASRDETLKSINEQRNIISHIQEILTIQRQYVTGRDAQDRRPVNLKDVILDCHSMLFASYDKKGIAVALNLPDNSPTIKGDRTKLMQVILNLLKNSIEAINMDAPEKRIEIRLTSVDKVLQLTIHDTGNGFDEATALHLFERGYSTKNTGTGLGLYNCKSIIESHAGVIQLDSKGIGMGTAVTIRFSGGQH